MFLILKTLFFLHDKLLMEVTNSNKCFSQARQMITTSCLFELMNIHQDIQYCVIGFFDLKRLRRERSLDLGKQDV